MTIKIRCKHCRKKHHVDFPEEEGEWKVNCPSCKKENTFIFSKDMMIAHFLDKMDNKSRVFFQKYYVEGKPLSITAKEMGLTKANLSVLMKKRGFVLRTFSQAKKIEHSKRKGRFKAYDKVESDE